MADKDLKMQDKVTNIEEKKKYIKAFVRAHINILRQEDIFWDFSKETDEEIEMYESYMECTLLKATCDKYVELLLLVPDKNADYVEMYRAFYYNDGRFELSDIED